MKNKQKLDGLQWIGVICFSLAFPVFMIGVINDMVGFAVDGILLVGSGAALFLASKRRKTKMYSTVQDLIAKAQASTELANEADDIETFLSYYHSMLSETHELIAFEDRVPFTLKPSTQYDIFVNNKQWHTRDAIERHYNSVKKAAKTTYRNSRSHVESLCRIFADEIEKHKNEFDDETMEFAIKLRNQLFAECGVINTYAAADGMVRCEGTMSGIDISETDGMEGHEFENYCADLLRKNGFVNVSVTPGSGDQGVDVIAEKEGVRYAIQCKCYSSALGNTPVQEVCAGKSMYNCHVGVVMTNNYFTAGAKQLAEKNGILLWDRDKLQQMIDSTISEESAV